MGILAPAVVSHLLFGEQREHFVHKSRLIGSLDHADGLLVELGHGFVAFRAEVRPDQHFVNAVAHVGQSQIGNGIDLSLGHVHFKKVFHRFFPRFRRS